MKSNEYLKQLATIIKKQRILQGITQEELSFKCTVHRNEISLIERGRKDIRLSTLLKLSLILEIPENEILALKNYLSTEPDNNL